MGLTTGAGRGRFGIASLTACLLLQAGCINLGGGGVSDIEHDGPIREIKPEDFAPVAVAPVTASAPTAAASAEPSPQQGVRQAVAQPVATTPTPQVGSGLVRVEPGEPELEPGDVDPADDPLLLEAKVGDINGRPVFAGEFLEPLEGRLRAEARRMDRREWMSFAGLEIAKALRGMVTDELLRAEALTRLTPAQRQGLRFFLEAVRDDLRSANLGSGRLARERLREERGLTEEEFLAQRQESLLVRRAIEDEIDSRLTVSWRDVVQRYERDSEIYNPDPTARLRLIRVPADDAVRLSRVRSRLADGAPFAEIAASELNARRGADEGRLEVTFSGDYQQAELIGIEALNDAARGLSPGAWTGPVETGSSVWWVMLEGIERESISLYDAQLEIRKQILEERRRDGLETYIDRLLDQASVSDLEAMAARLLRIAAERYGPPREGRGG